MRFFRAVVCESKMSTPSSASIRRLVGAAGAAVGAAARTGAAEVVDAGADASGAAITGVCAAGVASLEAAVAAWDATAEASVAGSAGAKKLAS